MESGSYSPVARCGLLVAVASLVAEHSSCGLVGSTFAVHGPYSSGSVAVVHRLSHSEGCGIFLDQGSNLCPMYCKADS